MVTRVCASVRAHYGLLRRRRRARARAIVEGARRRQALVKRRLPTPTPPLFYFFTRLARARSQTITSVAHVKWGDTHATHSHTGRGASSLLSGAPPAPLLLSLPRPDRGRMRAVVQKVTSAAVEVRSGSGEGIVARGVVPDPAAARHSCVLVDVAPPLFPEQNKTQEGRRRRRVVDRPGPPVPGGPR